MIKLKGDGLKYMVEIAQTGGEKKEKKKFELKDPLIWDFLYFFNQGDAFDAYREMIQKGKDSDAYKEAKEKWQKARGLVQKIEAKLSPEVLSLEDPQSYLDINFSEEKVRQKIEELRQQLEEKGITTEDFADAENSLFEKEEEEDVALEQPPASSEPIAIVEPGPTAPTVLKNPEPAPAVSVTPEPLPTAPTAPEQPVRNIITLKDSIPVRIDRSIRVKPDAYMGTWDAWTGGKVPANEAEIKRYVKRVGNSLGKNTMAYAYAENLLKNFHERGVRGEAEENRQSVGELENENKALKRELEELKEAQVQGGGVFEAPKDGSISRLEREIKKNQSEIEPVKKGWGSRFAEGFKKLFSKFKKSFDRTPPPKTLGEALREDRVVEIRDPEDVAKAVETSEERGENLGRAISELQKSTAASEQAEKKKIKGSSVLGWFKERAKGFATLGLWEVGRATGFYIKTENAGADTKAQADLLQQEGGQMHDIDEAREEAIEIDKKLEPEKETGSLGGDKKDSIQHLSEDISLRKKLFNKTVEDRIVASTMKRLEDKLKNKVIIGKEYMRAHGGKMLAPERMAEVEKRLREEIGKIRRGQVKKDVVDFAKLYRQSLDQKWWTRYIYGPVEAALWFVACKWVAGSGAENVASGSGPQSLDVAMKDSVWNETKRFLVNHGWNNPTDTDVLKYAKQVAQDSGVAVKEWGMSGNILDTKMSAGHLLKFGNVAAELAKLGF